MFYYSFQEEELFWITADKNIIYVYADLCILPDLCKLLLTCSPSTAFLSPLFFFDRCLDSCRWILDWRGFPLHCLHRQTYASRRQPRALWKTLTQLQHFKIRFLPLSHTAIIIIKNNISGHHKCVLKVQIKLGFETQPRCCGGKVFNHFCGVHLSRFICNYILKIKHFLIKYRRILSSPMA